MKIPKPSKVVSFAHVVADEISSIFFSNHAYLDQVVKILFKHMEPLLERMECPTCARLARAAEAEAAQQLWNSELQNYKFQYPQVLPQIQIPVQLIQPPVQLQQLVPWEQKVDPPVVPNERPNPKNGSKG